MGALPVHAWALALALGAPTDSFPPVEPARPRPGGDLSAEDARYLDWLVEDFLFDPRRAVYVRHFSPAGSPRLTTRHGRLVEDGGEYRDGWLVRGSNGAPDRVYFADGESVPASPGAIRYLDFERMCVVRLGSAPPVVPDVFFTEGRVEAESAGEFDLVLAAWLHRRGYDRLAAAFLDAARDRTREDPRAELRAVLARQAYDALLRGFENRDDPLAVAHAARLFALYPDVAAERLPHAAVIAADIQRRVRAGIGCRVPPKGPPAEFAGWDVAKKVAFLIASLDEIAGGSGNRWELDLLGDSMADWRVTALVELGDPAIPALIDALEKDTRLTRRSEVQRLYCSLGRGDRRAEEVFPVRDVVRQLIRTILRVRDFDPSRPPGAADDDDSPATEADRLRRYWGRYSRMAFPDRMMAILTDPATSPDARREAASSLVDAFPASPSSWSRTDRRRRDLPAGPSPLVARYSRPTVAEAILAAMDRHEAERKEGNGRWEWIIAGYLDNLSELGDPRAGPELARRANAAANPLVRHRLAWAAHTLGVSGPFIALTREVAAGTVHIPVPPNRDPDPQAARKVLEELIDTLIDSRGREADDALYALADPRHPYFPVAAEGALGRANPRGRDTVWQQHPLCVAVLRTLLSDRRLTGGHSYRRGTEVEDVGGDRPRRWAPPGGADAAGWLEHVERRVADDAAERLQFQVVGLPEYHPLRRNSDRVLAETRAALARFDRRFRRMTWEEQTRWEMRQFDLAYVPDIKPLGRPATAEDVRSGKAVFELNGQGRPADAKPPTWVVLKADAKKKEPTWGLVVQAELGPDGKPVYGVIFRHSIRTVKADEVARIESSDDAARWAPSIELMRFSLLYDR
jgi:hypothetical protein